MTLHRLGSSTGVWRMENQLTSIERMTSSSVDDTLLAADGFFVLESPCSSPSYSREESLASTDSAIDCDSDADLAVSPLPLVRGKTPLDFSDNDVTNALYSFIKNYVSAPGSSTVAIDNKIEQAMDLVKSHLMFAVREEVEVLKERITELLERIAFLEAENSLLRAAASQETLSQISQLECTQRGSSSSGSSNTGMGSGSSLGPANGGIL